MKAAELGRDTPVTAPTTGLTAAAMLAAIGETQARCPMRGDVTEASDGRDEERLSDRDGDWLADREERMGARQRAWFER